MIQNFLKSNIDLLKNDTFSFSIDLIKSEPSTSESPETDKRWVSGIASTSDEDLQGEVVNLKGLDTSYFLKHGFFNSDHDSTKKCGEPTEAKITDKGLWVKGFLYKNLEISDYWWKYLNALKESDASRRVCMSIEGKIVKRNGNTIQKAFITAVALTMNPVNTNTWLDFAKSLSSYNMCKNPEADKCTCCSDDKDCDTGSHESSCACQADEKKALTASGGGAPLRVQSLEGKPIKTTYKSLMSTIEAVEFLRQEHGYSKKASEAIVKAFCMSNGFV